MIIKIVGIGLDGKKSLTDSVLEIINQATVLIGGDRHLKYFSNHRAKKKVINNLETVINGIKKYQKKGENIVILATGDPLFFGIGRILLNNFLWEELEFYPHSSCVQLAFNKLKIPWQDAKFISLHGREIDLLIKELKKSYEKLAILTDKENNPLVIWQIYQQLKSSINYDFWLCENLGSQEEKITKIEKEDSINLNLISLLNMVVLVRKEINNFTLDLEKLPLIGLCDKLFKTFPDQEGLITKKEVRLMILGALALQEKQIIWDIGAGTGSVSIEIARLINSSKIYAIEKTTMGVTLIKENCQRFQVNNIQVIHDYAEKIINNLPNPHRIFIGGNGGNLTNLLEIIKTKINDEGKIVIALATIENLNEALQWLKKNNWHYEITNLQISKSLAIGKNTRLNPLNPVNIITANPLISREK
ncbi:MAG: precorrin-6y C5,15-methyltransferase (decarboxylating) subunit CbiE [Cyanobacteria bacterium]|nr:precorrin-6y C5,15-methyltransferase (decarboxylating) subunit CbiE [Cyanobacteria bacterium CG_2015-16_32_12]NCO78171.1 precorrin-6y C5,15-methyltransferase (decarboxylating) subunit CbiE [Cyanobacteria bacterium CG_2015-22_32_23]NCQ04608.1 precorrin-6y C5,15-methyltransferase (decarboxylating) subunit CbiE [Cyanobacteria bacterium CG_2015-09_32_10]NCQ43141.1 precorrin-6y C5,15-methyltransferase (decarboxylating) subunit CbiE [Cyanobacteria bacterium CG_2015-04_32_10]NCS84162.1 precorrin-6y